MRAAGKDATTVISEPIPVTLDYALEVGGERRWSTCDVRHTVPLALCCWAAARPPQRPGPGRATCCDVKPALTSFAAPFRPLCLQYIADDEVSVSQPLGRGVLASHLELVDPCMCAWPHMLPSGEHGNDGGSNWRRGAPSMHTAACPPRPPQLVEITPASVRMRKNPSVKKRK